MASRRLIRSIPFWVLVAGSAILAAVGAWIVLDRLGRLEGTIRDQTGTGDQIDATINLYIGQPAAIVGAVLLGAGLVGLLLALALAAARSLVPEPATEVVEAIDWTSDGESAPEATAWIESSPAASEPATVAEDPDVETTSTTPAPPAAAAEQPEPAAEPEARRDDDAAPGDGSTRP